MKKVLPHLSDIMRMGWDAGEYINGLWTYFLFGIFTNPDL